MEGKTKKRVKTHLQNVLSYYFNNQMAQLVH